MDDPENGTERDGDLGDLLCDFLEAVDRDPSSHAQLIEQYCDSHPDLADEFRLSVKELAEVGLLDDGDEGDTPKEYAGYTVERRLGAGGMGIVYLSLARRVRSRRWLSRSFDRPNCCTGGALASRGRLKRSDS